MPTKPEGKARKVARTYMSPPAPPKCSCGDTSCPGPCEHGGCVCEGPHDPNHQGYRQPDSAPPPCDCAGCVWFARARAALALMDEADWHVEAPKEGT